MIKIVVSGFALLQLPDLVEFVHSNFWNSMKDRFDLEAQNTCHDNML